jgi:hypothetical protein
VFDREIQEQIAEIASRFQLFQCVECARAIKEFLISKRISGKQLKLFTGSAENPYGNIFHEVLKQNIATNGRHEGIAVRIDGEELVFDNIHHDGVSRELWLGNLYCCAQDIGEDFQIIEIDF